VLNTTPGRSLSRSHQRQLFLLASGVSTAGSFAGLTAKGWVLMDSSDNALVLALHFAAIALPSLLISGPAGVRADRVGCERVLIQAQWALLGAGILAALAVSFLNESVKVVALLTSTFLVGVAGAFELSARNKYCMLLVDGPDQLPAYLNQLLGGIQRGQADRAAGGWVGGGHARASRILDPRCDQLPSVDLQCAVPADATAGGNIA